MKTNLLIVLLVLTFFRTAPAAADSPSVLLLKVTCPGREMEFRMTEQRYVEMSVWSPDSGEKVPLDMMNALAIAKERLKAKHPRYTSFETSSISLNRTYNPKSGSRFYYSVSLAGQIDGKPVGSCGLQCVVLLDGTTVDLESIE